MVASYIGLFVGLDEVDGKGYYRVEIGLVPLDFGWLMPHGLTFNQVNSDWGTIDNIKLFENRKDTVGWSEGAVGPVNFYSGSEVIIRPGTLRIDFDGTYVPMFSISPNAVRKERVPYAFFDEFRVYLGDAS